ARVGIVRRRADGGGTPVGPDDRWLAGSTRRRLEDGASRGEPLTCKAAAGKGAVEGGGAEGLQPMATNLDPRVAAMQIVDQLAKLRRRVAGAVVPRVAARVQGDQAIARRENRIEEGAPVVIACQPV